VRVQSAGPQPAVLAALVRGGVAFMAGTSRVDTPHQADSVTILEPSGRLTRMPMRLNWPACLPPAVAIAIALIPPPEGLAAHAWYFFALFMGVIVGLLTEPIPGPAISLIGVTLVTVLAPWVLYSPAELSAPGFDPANASVAWALSGFSNRSGSSSVPSPLRSAMKRLGWADDSPFCSFARWEGTH
jgi:hypothetical protein